MRPFPMSWWSPRRAGSSTSSSESWLDGPQTGAAKRYDVAAEAMTAALGPQGVNPSPHFRAVMLCPRDRLTKFEAADRAIFRTEFWTLVAETHNGEILAVAAGEDVPRVRPLPDPRE